MKAVVVAAPGDSGVLEIKEVAKPSLKDNWSLVKVMGFGINRSEIFTRKGYSPSVKFPRILGIECVGVIEESTDTEKLPRGQKILSVMGEMGRAFDGSYAEYVLLPNAQIYPVETTLSWAEFAAIPETYYTAYGAFKNLKISASDSVLVRGGASGVGVAFVRLVKAIYPTAKIFAAVRNKNKEAKLKSFGYDEVILERAGRLDSRRRFTKILELIGPATIKDSLIHLAEEGIICSCGQLGGQWYLEEFDPILELQGNVYLTTFYSGNITEEKIKDMLDFIALNKVAVTPERIFCIDDIKKAHDYLESDAALGKVVVINEEATYGGK